MRPVSRRAFLSASSASLAGLATARISAAQLRRDRVLLNSNFSGPQAFFFVAQDRGYLKAAGLDVAYVEGDGAAAIVPRVGAEGFDFGYGDLNALVPLVSRGVEYRHHTPDLYGNALLVSRRVLAERPDDVKAFVRAVNHGLADTIANLDAAIDSVAARDPKVRKDVDTPRLAGTLAMEMAHPDGARLGIGDADDGRLARGIALIAKSRGLPRVPHADEIFTRACLPPMAERIKTLAR